ncbi:MAG TPA: hypothetical protein VK961_26850 [Chthoniobacter sp.]|nr:hypothetical protein [Chthoniobacter sp.]
MRPILISHAHLGIAVIALAASYPRILLIDESVEVPRMPEIPPLKPEDMRTIVLNASRQIGKTAITNTSIPRDLLMPIRNWKPTHSEPFYRGLKKYQRRYR